MLRGNLTGLLTSDWMKIDSHDDFHLDKGLFENAIYNQRDINPEMHRIELKFGSFCKF